MFFLIILTVILTLVYWYLKQNYNYWKNLGIPGPDPYIIVGNLGDTIIQKRGAGQIFLDIYNEYKKLPFVGIYKASIPALLVRDPNFIKNIMVKDFNHFRDNDIEVDEKVDLIMGKNPFGLKGDQWKYVRSLLTPSFSSGKIKSLLPLILDVGDKMVDFIEEASIRKKKCLEMKQLSKLFTTNNVASCAFGLDGKSFEDPNSEFNQIAAHILPTNCWTNFLLTFANLFPVLANLLSISLIPKNVAERTHDLMMRTLKYRKDNSIVRKDFLNILCELKATIKNDEFTDRDITAHAAGFIGDGIETSAVVLAHTLYELAANMDVQQKLRAAILKSMAEENNGEITYEMIQDISFLDAVISEALRIHPPVMHLSKECTEDYTYSCRDNPDLDELTVTVKKGTKIVLPIWALHRDPKYFPDPDLFIPDRFFKENRSKLHPFTYLPMGEGPRVCLGQRFGLLQIKVGLIFILKNFELRLNEKTRVPLVYDPTYLMLNVSNGLWVDFVKI